MSLNNNYFVKSMSLGFISKLFDSIVKFISIPILISYLGYDLFGLLTLIFSLNSFSQILNLGVNTGAVKFFSEYVEKNDEYNIEQSAKVSLGFYLIIAVINCLIYLALIFTPSVLNVNDGEINLFQNLLSCSIFFTFISWFNNTFEQIITSRNQISFLHSVAIIRSVFYLLGIFVIINLEIGVLGTFVIISLANLSSLPLNIFFVIKNKFISNLLPSFRFKPFRDLFIYSSGIFFMGFFQMTAVYSKPIILKAFNPLDDNLILTEYRILEVFPLFLTSMGGIAIATLLPLITKFNINNNFEENKKFILRATSISSFLICFICFPLMLLSKWLLYYYVGSEFVYLSLWLVIWFLTTIIFLHNVPFATYILSTGRTKQLVISSAIGCIISIISNIFLVDNYGVGSAIISYGLYIIFQIGYYYLIIIKLEKFSSKILFTEFAKFFILGISIYLLVNEISIFHIENLYGSIIKVIIWISIFIIILKKVNWFPKFKNII